MDNATYIRSLLSEWSKQRGCDLHFTESPEDQRPSCLIDFNGTPLGYLSSDSLGPEWIQIYTKQMAPLLKLPDNFAAPLDSVIQKLHEEQSHFDWTGIYRRVGHKLHLTCFRGNPSPHEVIPLNQGICGAAVTENSTINIEDVSTDSRYLSCDFRTRSELVVPIRDSKGNAIAEIDVDSHEINAFGKDDEQTLETLGAELSPLLEKLFRLENG